MRVFLKSLSGAKTPLDAGEAATVGELKEQFSATTGLDQRLLRMMFLGKVLEDSQTLADSGVCDGSQIVYMVNKEKPETSEDAELLLGEQYESAIQAFVDQGFPRAQAIAAMLAGGSDASLARELLETGAELDFSPEEEEPAEAEGNPLAFLQSDEAFLAARRQLRSDPSLITKFLDQLQENNPELLAIIGEYPNEFQELLDAPDAPEESTESPALSETDRAAIARLVLLGHSESEALSAYLSCGKQEDLAASFLAHNQ